MRNRKLPGGITFLLIVSLIYFVIAMTNPDLFRNSIDKFWEIFKNIIPILFLVFLVIFLINLFIKPEKIKKHLGESSGIKGWIYTLAASALITMPPYVLYPVLGDLRKHGMKNSLIAAFMYNRNVQAAFIPAMIYYFGWLYTVIFAFYIIIFSIISGLIVGKFSSKQPLSQAK